ncbi:MAG: carbamoyltransferase C-terminal domain-containing protein [Planctomycetota bacterium]|nr:carbamoyltransferase C-terminal domain-containing protein [Planctomycetota bacterium]
MTWFQLLNQKRTVQPEWSTRLGPWFNDVSVARELKEIQIPYQHYDSSMQLVGDVSQALTQGSVVGWFQGAMEFGPRALGGRSLLADARSSEMQVRLNQRVKGRESFRPFAPMVSEKGAPHFFDVDQGFSSPYMTRTAKVRGQRESGAAENEAVDEPTLTFAERLTESRSDIPAVTHVDQSARIQTVKPGSDKKLESLLDAFEAKTGVPVLINTSFNVKDEPIVCHPLDAVKCFLDSEMDLLVIENQVIDRAKMGDLSAIRKRLAQRDHSIRNQGQKTQQFPWGVVAVTGLLLGYFVLRLVLALSFAKPLSEVEIWRLGVLSLLSVSSMIMFSLWPQSSQLAHQLLIGLLKPLGQGLSLLTLTLIYGFVVIPIALFMRMRGHDPLGLRSSQEDDGGWQTRLGVPKARYFRQFR